MVTLVNPSFFAVSCRIRGLVRSVVAKTISSLAMAMAVIALPFFGSYLTRFPSGAMTAPVNWSMRASAGPATGGWAWTAEPPKIAATATSPASIRKRVKVVRRILTPLP